MGQQLNSMFLKQSQRKQEKKLKKLNMDSDWQKGKQNH